MKPIGIGYIKTAQPKSILGGKPLGQGARDHASGQRIPLEHKKAKGYEEPEGQLSVDVYQTADEIIIVAPIAGTPPSELAISITDDVITIKGRRQIPTQDNVKLEDFYLQECFWGNFSRSIILPAAIDARQVEARFKHNVLTIRIPKTERVRTRVITIQED